MKDATQQVEFYRQIGENIRNGRIRRKLSQDTLAKLVGLTRTSLTNIESGRQHPPLHTFCDIADQLQVTVMDLLPRRLVELTAVDVGLLVGSQLRGQDELAFINTALRANGRNRHGDTKEEG